MDKMNTLREGLQQLFKPELRTEFDLDRFKRDINSYLQQLAKQGYLSDNLSPVEVTDLGNGQIAVDILKAFKNFEPEEQEELVCRIIDVPRDNISKFEYNNEGYISGAVLNTSISKLQITLEVENG